MQLICLHYSRCKIVCCNCHHHIYIYIVFYFSFDINCSMIGFLGPELQRYQGGNAGVLTGIENPIRFLVNLY
jgi:hypothetical protein